MSSSHPSVVKLDISHQKLLVQPDDPLPVFYPAPQAVMVTPIYDRREIYRSPSRSPGRDRGHGRRRYSPPSSTSGSGHRDVYTDSDYDNRGQYASRSHRPRRESSHREPARRYRRYSDDSDAGRGRHARYPTRSPSRNRYDDRDYDYSSDGSYGTTGRPRHQPSQRARSDLSRSRPVGQGPVHPMTGAAHINPSAANGHAASIRPSQHPQQQAHSAHSAATQKKPNKPGFFSSLLGRTSSQGNPAGPSHGYPGSHAPSHGGHAPSHGTLYAPSQGIGHSQSQGSQQQATDPWAGMRLPPATRMLLNFAIEKGILNDMTRYFQVLPPSPNFTYSKCTGRKKAVCIGINYVGQRDELKGCANDARNMREFLIRNYGFKSQDILLLIDDEHSRGQPRPTHKEMFNAMAWLVKDAKCHDSLFFHYSGHGGQSPDASGKELDGMDEVIFPVDYDNGGQDIIDDELHDALVRNLAPGVRLTAVFDSCHSGTVLDLPYLHSAHGRLRSLGHISQRAKKRGPCDSADVICLAACRDDEKSTDTRQGGVAVGAMSWVRSEFAFIQALKQNRNMTYDELLHHLRETLIPKYHQKAQISGTHPLDLNRQFTL